MPQHLWHAYGNDHRFCDACEARQIKKQRTLGPRGLVALPG
jgi:hypothetical protein